MKELSYCKRLKELISTIQSYIDVRTLSYYRGLKEPISAIQSYTNGQI